MADIQLHTFGALWVERRDQAGPVFHGGSACRLLVLLASGKGFGWRRSALARLLWPGAPEAKRQHSLGQVLSDLRKRLGSDAIEDSSETVRLPAGRWRVDFVEFERAVSEARWREAAALYAGPFAAEGNAADAIELNARLDALQARLHVKATHCFVRLISRALSEGDLVGAERWARTYVAIDPISESARRLLLQVLHAGHHDADALAVFEEYRTFLDRLIGDDPSVGLYGLASDIGRAANEIRQPARRDSPREVPDGWRLTLGHHTSQ